MLVVTPRPLMGESLMGYLLHLTEANAYPSTSYIVSSLNGRWYASAVGRLDARPLGALAKLEPAEVARLTMLPEGKPRAFVRVCGNDLPSYEVNTRAPKICPLCLKDGGRCEAFWDLTQAAACPRHGIRLQSTCPDCDKPLRWSRTKVRVCKCGSDLASWPAETVSGPMRDLMELMRNLAHGNETAARGPESLRHLEHLSLRQLCKLLWVMTYVVREQGKPNRSRSKARNNYRKELEAVAEILSNWPNNFNEFLEDRYSKLVSGTKPLPPFKVPFSWLTTSLIRNVEGGLDAYRFLGQEVFRFGARHWTRFAMSTDLGSADVFTANFRWGTHGEACEVLGLHILTLKKLIQAGEIPTKKIAGKSRRAVVVDLEWARSLRQSQHPAISIRDAAKRVGVSIETLKEMCASGLYEQRYRPSYPGSLTVEDVDALGRRLASLLEGKHQLRGKETLTLDRAFAVFGASPAEKAAVYQWLLEHPDLVLGRVASGEGAGRLQMTPAAVESFLTRSRDQDACVTVRVAANQLGCADAIITALKRAGHLECRKVRGRLHPRKASLTHFASRYESMSQVARRSGVPIKRVYARVDFSTIRHVKVKSVQYNTVFVMKADVAKAEKLIAAIKAT